MRASPVLSQRCPHPWRVPGVEGLEARIDGLGPKATYLGPKDGLILKPGPLDVIQVSIKRFGLGYQVGQVHLQGVALEFGPAIEGGKESSRLSGRGGEQGVALGALEKAMEALFELIESAEAKLGRFSS